MFGACGNTNKKNSKMESKNSSDSVTKKNNSDSIINSEEVKIGTQIWAIKNLDVSTFRNGDDIPEVKTDEEWLKAGIDGKPAWCYYNNDPANGKKYGKLYNFYAIHDKRGLAPKGWHVPNDAEWSTLTDYLGGEKEASTKMKSISGWEDYEGKSGNGTNTSNFTGLPGGSRLNYGPFEDIGIKGCWFFYEDFSGGPGLSNNNILFQWLDGSANEIGGGGFSVRCLRD